MTTKITQECLDGNIYKLKKVHITLDKDSKKWWVFSNQDFSINNTQLALDYCNRMNNKK